MNRIELMLSELLLLAKPQAEAFHYNVDLEKLIHDVILLMQSQANMYNIELVFVNDSTISRITCNHNQLKQVFINFVKNSIEAMPKGGSITIEMTNHESGVLVRFRDQGMGLSPQMLKRIGEPFYSTKEKGTGLGMMVSKKIIDGHHGGLKVYSELHVGTTVEVLLPVIGRPEV